MVSLAPPFLPLPTLGSPILPNPNSPVSSTNSYTTFQSLVNATISLDAPYQDAAASLSEPASATSQVTARRLRRVRQRMGAYRHDLLVAMRVVNKVEREMVQAEWESWLEGEARRCEQARELLLTARGGRRQQQQQQQGGQVVGVVPSEEEQRRWGGGGGGGDGDEGGKEGQQRRAALREWFAEYCTSCAVEQRKVIERMGVPGF